MKNNMKSFICNLFVVALFVCLSVQYGSGLKCYECNDSLSSQNCSSVTSSMIKECANKDSICSTSWNFLSLDGKNITYVGRTCVNVTMSGRPKFFFRKPQSTLMYCNTDLCNAAAGVPSTKTMLFISAVLSLFFFKDVY